VRCRTYGEPRWRLSLCWLCLALLLAPATSWADSPESESSPPSASASESLPSDTPTTEPQPTDPWASFDESWTALKDELTAWSEDSERLSRLLEGLQTEAEGLRSSLALSIERYESSEAARLREREAAAAAIYQAERARDRWRMVSITAAGAAAGALAAGPIGAAVGAAAGFILSIFL